MAETKLIRPDGTPQFGLFPQTPDVINASDFNYRTPMGSRQLPGRKWLDYNQFQYIGVVSPELLVGCALGDFRYLGFAFVYTFDPATGDLDEFSVKLPLGRGISLTDRPADGSSVVSSGGNRIEMNARRKPREVQLKVSLKSGLEVDATFNLDKAPKFEPLALCTQTARNGWAFTQKIAGVPATGTVSGKFGTKDLASTGAYAHYDYTVGYMRRETFWNWACFAGNADGKAIGLNLSCGVNETSFSENCVWVDGKLYPVGLASFDYDRNRPDTEPWKVSTTDGRVDLDFIPEGIHTEKVNAIIIQSNFKQIFGKFNGVLRPDGGDPIEIKNLYGFVEDQYAKW